MSAAVLTTFDDLYGRDRGEAVPDLGPAIADGAVFVTAGVDVQSDRIECEVVGWSEGDALALPDRLSIDPASPHYDGELLPRVGVRLNGRERNDVAEYSVALGWARIIPPSQRRTTRPGTVLIRGTVEPYWRA